jgi:hypothetical protein
VRSWPRAASNPVIPRLGDFSSNWRLQHYSRPLIDSRIAVIQDLKAMPVTSSIDISIHSFPGADMCHAGVSMRDPETIETELMEISAIADDTLKFERIIAWCASHPDEVPFALHQLMGRPDKHPSKTS